MNRESLVQLILLFLSTVCAVIPMVGFLAVVWLLDRYDREPVWLYVLTFLWGAIGAILLAMIGSVLMLIPVQLILPAAADALGAVLVAPLIEEPAKAIFLVFVMLNRHFDNMTDGFVYGAAAGLGFGMTENFLYFAGVGLSGDAAMFFSTVVVRTLYSAVMHASATAVVGAALGYARFRGLGAMLGFGALGLLVAMGVHALWNGLLTLDFATGGSGALFGLNLLLLPLEVLFLFLIFQICLLEEAATIRRELREEVSVGVIPEGHPRILASWLRRRQVDWVPPGVDQRRYVEAATSLALRKKQARSPSGTRDDFYQDEVDRLRRQIRAMLDRTGATA